MKQRGTAKTATGAVVVFEIASPSRAGIDCVTKVEKYAAVPSIIRYVIVESASRGVLNLHREPGESQWRTRPITEVNNLPLAEVGIAIPVAELYEGVDLDDQEVAAPQR